MSRSTADRPDLQRRQLLLAGAAGLGLSLSPGRIAANLSSGSPFSLGVASGEPVADGFVIWTRLATDPLAGGGMPGRSIPVTWEVAADERFQNLIRSGQADARPAWAHSVHVEVQGLEPDREYWYRFRTQAATSAVGRSRTTTPPGLRKDRLRLAVASCQNYEHGHFGAYRHMAQDDLDLIVHVGDYIYGKHSDDPVRMHSGGDPQTLDEYRNRYAQYRMDADLQRAHAHCPWLVSWDDHEVANDYAGLHPAGSAAAEEFRARRTAAYQAYWEHMPLSPQARPRKGAVPLFRRAEFGDLLRLHVLDTRQHRDDQACATATERGGRLVGDDCTARLSANRSMLGAEQERWLRRGLTGPAVSWNVLAQQVLVAPLDRDPGAGQSWATDPWDGYPANRDRLLNFIASRGLRNVVALSGDIHSFWANDLPSPDRSSTVATEFVTTSIASRSAPDEQFLALRADNPHIRHVDARHRGYLRCTVTGSRWTAEMLGLADVRDPASAIARLRTFAVEAGRPGVLGA